MMLVTFPNFAANVRIKSVTCNFLVKFLSTPAEISCFSIIICTIDDLVAKVAPRYAKSCHCGEKTCRSLNHHPKKGNIWCFGTQITQTTQILIVSAESAWKIQGVLARRLRRILRSLSYLRNLRDLRGKYRVSWHADYVKLLPMLCASCHTTIGQPSHSSGTIATQQWHSRHRYASEDKHIYKRAKTDI